MLGRSWKIGIFGSFDGAAEPDFLSPVLAESELRARLGDVELRVFSPESGNFIAFEDIEKLDAILITRIRSQQWFTPVLVGTLRGIPVIWEASGVCCGPTARWADPLLRAALESSAYVVVRDEAARARLVDFTDRPIAVFPDVQSEYERASQWDQIAAAVRGGAWPNRFSRSLQSLGSVLENVSSREAGLYHQLDSLNRENAAQRGLIAVLKDMIEQAAERETDVCDLLAEQETETQKAQVRTRQLADDVAALRVRLDEVEQQAGTARTLMHDLEQELEITRSRAEERERRIEELTNSLCWRLTAPIRFLGRPLPAIVSVVRRATTVLW